VAPEAAQHALTWTGDAYTAHKQVMEAGNGLHKAGNQVGNGLCRSTLHITHSIIPLYTSAAYNPLYGTLWCSHDQAMVQSRPGYGSITTRLWFNATYGSITTRLWFNATYNPRYGTPAGRAQGRGDTPAPACAAVRGHPAAGPRPCVRVTAVCATGVDACV
jgi:hypothetical protein